MWGFYHTFCIIILAHLIIVCHSNDDIISDNCTDPVLSSLTVNLFNMTAWQCVLKDESIGLDTSIVEQELIPNNLYLNNEPSETDVEENTVNKTLNICITEDSGYNYIKSETYREFIKNSTSFPVPIDENELKGIDHDIRVAMTEDPDIDAPYNLWYFETYLSIISYTRACFGYKDGKCLYGEIQCDIGAAPFKEEYQRDNCSPGHCIPL
eukprot:UN25311